MDHDDDPRAPAVSAWTMRAVAAASSPAGGARRPRRAHRPRRAGRRAPVAACLVGAVVLLAGLGAAGPPTPVTAAEVLPPPDTSAIGATGRLPDPVPEPLPPGTPPLDVAPRPDPLTSGGSALGIPETVLAAYRAAATTVVRTAPGCRLTWPLVAGIGKVESGHASAGAVDADGTTRRPILGPQLTGTGGNAAIPDTDGGALDHDATWDRAVGPTQFIPSSWRTYGADGNGDGRADPDNVFDAGLATARYLCSGGGDLSDAAARHDAVFRYNHSEEYVATVLRWADAYASGALPVPDSTGSGVGDAGSALAGGSLAGGGLADGGVVDGTPTLAALPSPSTRVVAAGGTAGGAAAAPPMITSSGATRPTIGATRSPSSDLAPGPVRPAPMASSGTSSTPVSVTSSTPPGAPAAAPPGVPAPTSATSTSATSPSVTSPSATSTSATSTSATPSSSTASSTPPPAKPAAPLATPAPAKPAPSSTTSSTTTPTTTTPTTSQTPAARCAAALPGVARASGVPAARLVAATTAGPGRGRTTCTVRGPQGPVLVAVTAAPDAAPPSAPSPGLSRTVAGGRTVLTVPTTAGLSDDRARAVLAAAAAAWG